MHEQLDPSIHTAAALEPYDAVLLMSFGGPESADEVMPFLRRVTAGRGIPDERLAEVAEHYYAHGGRSPINDQCRALVAALTAELAARGIDLPVLWGNRNSEPYLSDVLQDARRDGRHRLVAVTTSAYPSYSSCRQYREDLGRHLPDGLSVDRIAHYALTPGFQQVMVDAVSEALDTLGGPARVLFVTHSIPITMSQTAGPPTRPEEGSYVAWHRAVADRVMAEVDPGGTIEHELVYCSRSGPPSQPWLEPDVNDRLTELATQGHREDVVLAPIGFVSDHMEVLNDLDAEAVDTATGLGLSVARAATAGTAPAFVEQLVVQLLERAEAARAEAAGPLDELGGRGDGLGGRGDELELGGRGEPVVTAAQAAGGPGWFRCPAQCCVNQRHPETPVVG